MLTSLPFFSAIRKSKGDAEAMPVVVVNSAGDDVGGGKGVTYTPLGDQQITAATLATKQNLTVPVGAKFAIMQNNTNQYLRWRDFGPDPTVSVGLRIAPGAPFTYDGNLATFEVIIEAAGTGTLDIAYYS